MSSSGRIGYVRFWVDEHDFARFKGACVTQPMILTVRGLGKSFGGVHAVDAIDFDLAAGELLAMIGPNGAGKSTTFNMINGQLRADRGSIKFAGTEIVGRVPREIWRLGVGRTFQIAQTFLSLTVIENVQMALLAHAGQAGSGLKPSASLERLQAAELLEKLGMLDQAERACADLAYSDVKRVELAMALANDPKLLLMDEPTAGMGPAERQALMALVKRLADERAMAVLFTEHSMDVVFDYADRMMVLARGRLIAQGEPQTIRNHPEVQAVYFGTGTSFETKPQTEVLEEPQRSVQQTQTLLEVKQLSAWYGYAQALFDVSLEVKRGEVVALMGRNGAGKSTTMKSIMGLLPKRTGQICFLDKDILALAPHQIAARGLGFVPEDRRIFTDLTVLENLETGRSAPRTWPDGESAPVWTVQRLFELFPNLGEMPQRPGGKMSGGEQQMLTVARTLMGNPFLVLLDEPSEGVAPLIVEQMAKMILSLKAQGVSILLCEQNLHFAALVCDRAYVLEKGQIRFSGSITELLSNEAVQRTYLSL